MKKNLDYLLIGPAYPFRGGIAETQHQLALALQKKGRKVELLTFRNLYPKILFPGKTQFSHEIVPEKLKITRLMHAYNPFYWRRVLRYVESCSPKFVVFRYYTPFLAMSYGWMAKRLSEKIIRVALVDNWIPHEKNIFDNDLNNFFGKQIDFFTTLSEFVAKQINNQYKKPIWSGFHPINENLLPVINQDEIRRKLNWEQSTNYVLFFGLIRKYKGLDLLIKSFSTKILKNKNIKLYVAGECYENPKKYFKLVEKLKLKKRIILDFKFMNKKQIQNLFSAADIIAQTYTTGTQSGVTPIAYHYNKPILISNINGLKNPIVKDKTGEVVKNDPQSIAKGIISLLEKSKKIEYTSNIKKNISKYSWTLYASMWDKYLSQNK